MNVRSKLNVRWVLKSLIVSALLLVEMTTALFASDIVVVYVRLERSSDTCPINRYSRATPEVHCDFLLHGAEIRRNATRIRNPDKLDAHMFALNTTLRAN